MRMNKNLLLTAEAYFSPVLRSVFQSRIYLGTPPVSTYLVGVLGAEVVGSLAEHSAPLRDKKNTGSKFKRVP